MLSMQRMYLAAVCITLLCSSLARAKDAPPTSSETIGTRAKTIRTATTETLTAEENSIILLILQEQANRARGGKPKGFEIVKPHTTLTFTGSYIQKEFARSGQNVKGLVDELIKKNKTPATIDLPTSSSYLLDRDGKFHDYLAQTDGWKKLRKTNPNALGMIEFSKPAIDRKKNLVMIYVGMYGGPKSGIGQVLLYKYKNGTLKQISRALLWIV